MAIFALSVKSLDAGISLVPIYYAVVGTVGIVIL